MSKVFKNDWYIALIKCKECIKKKVIFINIWGNILNPKLSLKLEDISKKKDEIMKLLNL